MSDIFEDCVRCLAVWEKGTDAIHFETCDIGQCDDCGAEDGPRRGVRRIVVIAGEEVMTTAWLCPGCRHV